MAALPTVQTTSQIMKELDAAFKPGRSLLQKQIGQSNVAFEGAKKGLEAKKTQAFGDITQGANRRGLLFSGIPLAEQARYTSTDFLPAMARLEGGLQDRHNTLQQAIAQSLADQRLTALGLRQQQLDRLEAARSAARAAAAQSSIFDNLWPPNDPNVLPETTPTDDDRVQFIKDNAQEYLKGITNNVKSQSDRFKILNALKARAIKGDRIATAKFNALSQFLGQSARINESNFKLSGSVQGILNIGNTSRLSSPVRNFPQIQSYQ